MVATPSNALNIQTAGYQSFDGTASFNGRTFQQGTGIEITNPDGISGNSSFSVTGSIIGAWTDEAVSFNAVKKNGYFVTANATATLPASPSQGDTISFVVESASGILTIQANTGQTIQIGKNKSSSAGTVVSNFNGDSVTLVYKSSTTNWLARDVVGTFSTT